MQFSRLPVRSLGEHPLNPLDRAVWPATLPPVARVLDTGLELGAATILVGENGSGKSTLVEAIALAYGLGSEGGSTGAMHSTRATESELWDHLQLVRNAGASKRGYFLRAETMHGFYTYLEEHPGSRPDIPFHERSHGESFIELVADRFRGPGLWVLDEPESALSFSGCLALLRLLTSLLEDGRSQVVLSTHSPVLAALPSATVYEVGEWGLRERPWMDLALVDDYTRFLLDPQAFLGEV
ncbi:AAA family ATPase [Conyzicola sp.]|uniref:AAA family ATPase n=1 Tax=Conyzicola sp. TaxID=1969404 RepID=UPI0039893721